MLVSHKVQLYTFPFIIGEKVDFSHRYFKAEARPHEVGIDTKPKFLLSTAIIPKCFFYISQLSQKSTVILLGVDTIVIFVCFTSFSIKKESNLENNRG